MNSSLTKRGKLKRFLLPAVYFDSSVVIDYWMTEGMGTETATDKFMKKQELPHEQVIRDILRTDKRINKVFEIREKLNCGNSKATAVITPLCMIELIEWYAEVSFRQMASDVVGSLFIKRADKKQIGDYLKKALEVRKDEITASKGKKQRGFSTGPEIVMAETWLNGSFAQCHGLRGLLWADLVNFDLSMNRVWEESSLYAYLQLGSADIMHIMAAEHLGCGYIASFDSDFKRSKDIIVKEMGVNVLTSPEEILSIM